MKKVILFFAALMGIVLPSFATSYTVTVSDFEFSPSTLTVQPGDAITWVWINGEHTTTSTAIPAGALPWDTAITTASPSFTYDVPEFLGTYSYKCSPHEGMGMVGNFTVIAPSSVSAVGSNPFAMYPNPASQTTRIQFVQTNSEAKINISDLTGRMVYKSTVNNAAWADIDTRSMGAGIYMVVVEQAGAMYRRELVVQ